MAGLSTELLNGMLEPNSDGTQELWHAGPHLHVVVIRELQI